MKYVKIFLKVLISFIIAFFVFNSSFVSIESIEDFDKAIESNPNDYEAYNGRGLHYSNLGQYKQAIKDYDKAIEINKYYAAAYNNRGLAYKALGDEEKAQADFDKAKKLGYKD